MGIVYSIGQMYTMINITLYSMAIYLTLYLTIIRRRRGIHDYRDIFRRDEVEVNIP
jgi:hypothetical protein